MNLTKEHKLYLFFIIVFSIGNTEKSFSQLDTIIANDSLRISVRIKDTGIN